MADKMLFAPLLFLIVLIWPTIIIPVTSNEACVYDNAVATLTGRSCRNRRCTIEENNCRGNRECLCDGACGYRCISTIVSYCRELEPPVNGSIEYLDGNRAFGARAAYECDHGYLLSGEDEVRTCLGEREWSAGETPRCISQGELCPRREGVDRECQQSCTRRKDCLNKHEEGCLCDGDCGMSCLRVFVDEYCPPVELSEGAVVLFMTTKKIVYRSKVMLGCENQYKIAEGNVNITCLLNRTWSGRPLRCTPKALCTSPPVIEGARHDSWEHRFYAGDELLYTCKPGYYTYGLGQTSTCRDDGQWTNVTLECYPKSCGDPGYLRNGRREGNLFTFLSRVTFHCNIGYEMRGYAHRTCMSDQRWSSFMPECVAIECPRLYAPEFGSLEGTRVTYGSEAYLECNRGYKLLGSEYRRCQANGTWSGEETTCRVITCPEPDTPDNGSKRSPRYGLDAITHFSCNSGYTLFGSSTTRCTADERWSEPTPECKGDCSVESSPRNGYFLHRYERYTEGQVVQHGTVIEVRCYRLYSLNSEEPYECIDGEWSFDAECVENPCPKLSELLNGQITYDPELVNQSQSTVPHETVATYSCLYGFEQQGGYSTTRCYFGAWNGRWEPVCEPKTCSKETLENGNVRYTKNDQDFSVRDQDPHHDVVRTARCSNGYSWEPSSRRQSVCENGEWSDSLPTCKPDACSTPDVDGGDIDVQSMRHGGTAQLTCRWNLKSSVGDGQLQCHAGHWVPDGIECINRDAPFNVAYGKPASQSPISEVSSRKQAPLAVDGDRTTDKNHGSCTVAKKSTQQVFWEVDLQNTYKIEYVVIYTKSKSQVRGATVQVGYSGMARQSYRQCGQEVNRRTVAVPESGLRVDCTSQLIAGQIVRIERQADSMSLCEVEVFVTGPVATCRIPDIAGMRQTLAGTNEELHAGTRVPPGTAIDYSCEGESYQHNGVRDNHCNSDGTWANTNPSCDAADCEVQAPENGWLLQQISRLPHGYQLAYSCRDRYEKAQDIVTHCESGELTPEPRCVPEHCRLQASDFGDVIINNNEPAPDADGIVHIPHGTKVHFTCARGHNLINQNRNTPRCWMGHLQDITHIPYCSPVTCDYPPYPQHGSYNLEQGDSAVHGSAIRYECYKGYQLQDPSKEYSYCVDGRWSPEELPVCQRLTVPVTETPNANAPCPTPSPPNALVFHNGQNIALIDSVINFGQGDWIVTRCINHYSANGRKAVDSMCSNGAWTPALPSCGKTNIRGCVF
ncbi:sushi, von Willebrand factor type A, EGF and pentraxin domain-containing protein 1-like [Acanthaster planci]|uniref:Sushi, von Willebrand factor type A, EGF and pentraxin domain-containing protein 1-like n=1 Tax=Acanthaster planci TaxID=133434 RepID=A0A8B7ZV43_ACAPL|nr:sushi, von Willebrand factor type A, EGF and pentraxin domain-containing protein 1-like [Acanthaster planci]